jgi:hypothetical protein
LQSGAYILKIGEQSQKFIVEWGIYLTPTIDLLIIHLW